MKKLLLLAMLMTAAQAFAGVQSGSAWPEDALLIDDLIQRYLERDFLITLSEADSTLVLFVSLGGEWTDSVDDWSDLMFVYAIASGVDLEKSWTIREVVVSFTDTWCSIPMEDIFTLSSDSILTEEEWWTELKSLTEVHIRE
jgi:hypothetical protein